MPKNLDFMIGLFFLAMALLFAIFMVPTIGEPWSGILEEEEEFYTVGPRFFPYLASGIVAACSLLLLVKSRREDRSSESVPITSFTLDQIKSAGAFVGIGLVYILLLHPLGVVVATPLCLASFFWYHGTRGWVGLLLVPLTVTAAIYIVFEKFMMIPLPEGILG